MKLIPGSFTFLFFLFLISMPTLAQETYNAFAQARRRMVDQDLRGRGIKDPRVLKVMSTIPRHLFVAERYGSQAYGDYPLPIGAGQTISQPYVVALMTELLELKGGEKVLEVGTGSGYQAAVLSRLVKEVYTIEIIPALAQRTRKRLIQLGYENVYVKTGDGFFGWEENGPFEAIAVTAATSKIPAPLWSQLREGGRLVIPLGEVHQTQELVQVRKINGRPHSKSITGVLFVPMIGEIDGQRP